MGSELIRAMIGLSRRLGELAERDEALRDDLRTLVAAAARAFGPCVPAPARAATSGGSVGLAPPEAGTADGPGRDAADAGSPPADEHRTPEPDAEGDGRKPRIELTLGRSLPSEPAPVVRKSPALAPDHGDLGEVEARCRLKAEGMRWAAERLELRDRGGDIGPRDRDLLDRGRALGNCLWMNMPEFAVPERGELVEEAAGSFEALADAAALVRRTVAEGRGGREHVEPALHLLAEAQSALRAAVSRLGRHDDPDQNRVFKWLRAEAEHRQIYVARHMKLDDPADPSQHVDLRARIAERARLYGSYEGQVKREEDLFGKIQFHAKRIGKGGDPDQWAKLAGAVDDLVGLGVPPSSVRVRDLLLPILPGLPGPTELRDPPPRFLQAVRAIERYLDAAEEAEAVEEATPRAPSAEVEAVARLLEGRSVLLVGGGPHEKSREALRRAFRLKEVIWVEMREHGPIVGYEPLVARPEVALVLLAIRWSSHSFEGVKAYCQAHGKPMVRMPRGYHPNQVAVEVLDQASIQLERALAERAAEMKAPLPAAAP